ncbi:MAG: hypothetical protein JO129_00010 [Candidatus Dependentiae bacterium]|nr:hypothetical protein [Candidatus Dependentiae bacterium]
MKKLFCLLACLCGFSMYADQSDDFISFVKGSQCPTPSTDQLEKDYGFRSIAMMEDEECPVPQIPTPEPAPEK